MQPTLSPRQAARPGLKREVGTGADEGPGLKGGCPLLGPGGKGALAPRVSAVTDLEPRGLLQALRSLTTGASRADLAVVQRPEGAGG